jgi:fibronectin-binding autotransporter adhesin
MDTRSHSPSCTLLAHASQGHRTKFPKTLNPPTNQPASISMKTPSLSIFRFPHHSASLRLPSLGQTLDLVPSHKALPRWFSAFCFLFVLLLWAPWAFAQNATWSSNSSTTWSTGTNWVGGSAPGGNATDRAFFNTANGSANPNITANTTTGAISFTGNPSTWTLSSTDANTALTLLGIGNSTSAAIYNASANSTTTISAPIIFGSASLQTINSGAGNLTLSGSVTKSTGDLAFAVAAQITVSGNLTVGGRVSISGVSALTLSGNNSAAGWDLANTTLNLNSSGALGSTSAINFTSTGYLVSTANNTTDYSSRFTVASGGNYSVAAVSGQTVTLASALAGNGTNAFRAGSSTNTGTVILGNATNSFTGSVSILGGTLSTASVGNSGNSSALGTNGTINIGGVGTTTAGALIYTGAGETTDKVINLQGSTGGATIQNDGGGTLKFTSNTTAAASAKTLTLQGSGTGEFAGIIGNGSGTIAVTKVGNGTWTLSGNNTYSGATTVRRCS